MLAIRNNPNVQQAQLNQVLQKYAVIVEQWKFDPHYALNASRTTNRYYSETTQGTVTENATGVEPSATLLTPIGTQLTLTSTNNVTDHYNPGLSMQIMQPLMRGYGKAVVEAELYNSLDNEKISRLHIESEIQTVITEVINAYLDVMSAQNMVEVDEDAASRSQDSLEQTKLFIHSGRKAGAEIITVEADIADAKTRMENDKNRLDEARYELLSMIGIDPDASIKFEKINIPQLIKKYNIPSLGLAKKIGIENDIQYQIDNITLQGAAKRTLLIAEDNTRWQLNLSGSTQSGNATGGGRHAGINSLVNGVNETNSVSLNLTVPIDDVQSKMAVENAKIAIKQAKIALDQEKLVKEKNILNSWKAIYSNQRASEYAQNGAKLQKESYQISFKKYSNGLIDSLVLQTSQEQFYLSQKMFVISQIAYLKSLVNLDLMLNNTLNTWDIKDIFHKE